MQVTVKRLQKNWYEFDSKFIYGGMLKKFENEKEVIKFVKDINSNAVIKFS